MSTDYILETKGLYKEFYGNLALDDVSISFLPGEVHAVCGENGAGKSTLMKVLCGAYIPEAGDIIVKGKKAVMKSAQDMVTYGISIIFQEFNLMPHLSIDENIYISNLYRKGKSPVLDKRAQREATKKLMEDLNLELNPKTLVSELSVSEKQMVEIAKALSVNADIIIMDEPTAALNNQEVEKLYNILGKLKAKGKTIIYVSHRMKEIFDLADRVTVLRDGKFVATKSIKEVDHESIASMMVGRNVQLHEQKFRSISAAPVLEVDSLTKEGSFRDVSFQLHKGEILGISGLMGCGREDVAKAIYALETYDSGKIVLNGKEIRAKTPADAMREGIMYLTDDRKESGIYSKMDVGENIAINALDQIKGKDKILISSKKFRELIGHYINYLNVKCAGAGQKAMFLSGGNQQKLLIARALTRECSALVLLEPTRGVDIATKAEIYGLLTRLSEQGMGILVVSSDLPEMITICDRILVMFQGEQVGEFMQKDAEEQAIMLMAIGKRLEQEGKSNEVLEDLG